MEKGDAGKGDAGVIRPAKQFGLHSKVVPLKEWSQDPCLSITY